MEGVVVDGAAADHERADGELIITPARPIAAGEEFAVSVDYAGAPDRIASRASSLPVGWITGADGTSYVIAEPDGASSWYPVNDHPLDKATYTFRVTVPNPWQAFANGTLVDTITDLGSTTRISPSPAPATVTGAAPRSRTSAASSSWRS